MKERLDKVLAALNVGSRKEVGMLIRKGAVTVNGAVIKKAETKVDGEIDVLCINGTALHFKRYLYIMLHKPAGVLSAAKDSRMKTVLDLLPSEYQKRGLFPAGRLDRDTQGLLILTNDGEFAHKMLAPKNGIQKVYHAKLDFPITQADIKRFAQGLTIGELQCLPAKLQVLEKGNEPWAQVTVCQGKFHQVKRMFAACNKTVLYLERVKIGNLELDSGLARGQSRELTEGEKFAILHK